MVQLKIVGIYKITNKANGKIYIGQTVNYEKRKRNHLYYLKRNNHFNLYLQNSFNKYGVDSFSFELIDECNVDELDEKERYYIDKYQSMIDEKGYNLLTGGQKYRTFSIEVRKRMSDRRKQYIMTPEHCKNISKGRKGIKMPKDAVERIKMVKKERKSQWGEDNPNASLKHSEVEDIIDDLLEGLPVREIVKKRNTTQDVVYPIMYNRTYTEVKPEVREKLKERTKYLQKNKEEKAIDLFISGKSQNQISKELKMSRNTIRELLKEKGLIKSTPR